MPDILDYPQTGFHFTVAFELFPQMPNDFRFQEVSGLTVNIEAEPYKEGGENRFIHQLPVRTNYNELVLKRGKFMGSGILQWCKNAIENFEFKPTNILISLLNEQHLPLYNWYVINAIPKRLEIGAFNAERSEVVIETMALNYQYFKYYDPATAAMDLAAGLQGAISGALSGSVSVGI
ncbi:phage tail protein [Chitinophaga sp. MM2321]|uniref:phage tail protein n=1 Tax=Chitinophaga sp. MM2321 TaxID=3137178 RepID=UPI0032D59C06